MKLFLQFDGFFLLTKILIHIAHIANLRCFLFMEGILSLWQICWKFDDQKIAWFHFVRKEKDGTWPKTLVKKAETPICAPRAVASNSIYSPQASNSKGLMMFHGPKYVLWKCVFSVVCVFMFDVRRTVFSASCRSILISFASSLISRVWSSLASFSDDVEATSTQPLLLSRLTLQKWLRPPPYSLNWPKGTIGAKVIKENYNFGLSPTRSSTMSLKTFLCTLKVI